MMKVIQIIGSDLSHNNTFDQIISGLPFYFLKATEGATWTDKKMEELMKETWRLGSPMTVYGFYHFAHPENNPYMKEVTNYLQKIKPHIGKCLTALDFEDKAVAWMKKVGDKQAADWIKGWLDTVREKTRSTPFLYASASVLAVMKKKDEYKSIFQQYPLWVAQYGDKTSYKDLKVKGNIWQFTSTPCDLDIYFGDIQSLIMKAIS